MTETSRHLVDPEIAPLLEVFPPLNLSAEILPLLRQGQAAPIPDTPDPEELFPGVVVSEERAPGEDGDPEVRVLLYRPRKQADAAPGLVWMHGGGYVMGQAEADDLLCRRIADETGAVIASVDYRLAPETPAPGPLHDCYAVLRWLHGSADTHGLDPARIAIGGASAGGGLAAALAILARDRAELGVSFQALVYPMLDDRTGSTTEPHPYAGDFIWTPNDNVFGWSSLLGGKPGSADVSAYSAAARVESVAGLPPTYLSVGALDLFAEEDLAYATRLLRAGVPTEFHLYPGAFHAYDLVPTATVTQSHLRDLIGALQRHWRAR